MAAATAGAVLLLGSGCTSGSGTGHSDSGTASAAAGGAEAICDALVTAQDLPAGYKDWPTPTRCDNDAKIHTASFRGTGGGLETLDELLEREENAAEASTRLPELVGELNKLIGTPPEQDATLFRDLGDEVHYFTEQNAKTHWNTLYIRRGRLVVYLSVTKLSPFSAADMHEFAAKAVQRASGLA
ncbi:hypothetical protein KCH_07930 [Kitasatospora cheerisanensis KCTC 2395]|uniref:Uncharacterized protein n=1 Tax=Kitasatospora cheerisanensis KCTC 2395 TaxID=1348663 RepID=A0A066ZAS8_9ACTN|nr:hypothetical protein KCH_07930 [Kitasatospora cheerisanensis KCTC 2395]